MERRPLGRTGVLVSELALGTMMFGGAGNPDRAECVRIVQRALEAGITFFNSAEGYSGGASEEILGEALAGGRRDAAIIATKFGPRFGGDPDREGGSRRWIVRTVEESLRRLRTEWIDVYEFGAPDPLTDIDETLSALTDLVSAGKVRMLGTSKMPPSQLVEARVVAERRGYGYFRVEESPYSMLTRSIEYDLIPTCRRLGTGVVVFGALAGGWLSGRYRKGAQIAAPGSSARDRGDRMDAASPTNAAKFEAADALGALADEVGLTLPQLATAFTLQHPDVSATIIGPRTMEQLEGSLAATGVTLSADVLDRIDQIVPPGSATNISDTMWQFGTDALAVENRRRHATGAPQAPAAAR